MLQARLKDVPFFSNMSKKEVAAVTQQTDEVDLPAGKVLAREGDFGQEFFVIVSGTAEVSRSGDMLAELGSAGFFGEMALLEVERRTATVRWRREASPGDRSRGPVMSVGGMAGK